MSAMKLYFGHGTYIELDEEPRESPHHRTIVRIEKIPNYGSAHWLLLDCGHKVMAFGGLVHANNVVHCAECRDAAERNS